MNAWFARHPTTSTQPIVDSTIKYARDTLKVRKLGVVGYCWGGPFVVRQLAAGTGVDAGFTAHPGAFTNAEALAIAAPLSLAAADTDFSLSASRRREVEDLLLKNKARYQIALYCGVSHGFAVSVDLNDRKQVFAKESAFNQAFRWFDEYLKGGAQSGAVSRKTDQRIEHDFIAQYTY